MTRYEKFLVAHGWKPYKGHRGECLLCRKVPPGRIGWWNPLTGHRLCRRHAEAVLEDRIVRIIVAPQRWIGADRTPSP